jgi:hypothetical protein
MHQWYGKEQLITPFIIGIINITIAFLYVNGGWTLVRFYLQMSILHTK